MISINYPLPLYDLLRMKNINISIEIRIPHRHIIFDSHIVNTINFKNATIFKIEPSATEQSSIVTIYGFCFENHSNLSCKFNDYTVLFCGIWLNFKYCSILKINCIYNM